MTEPDWLTEGADVVVLQPYSGGAAGLLKAEGTTITRLTKRDVVCANGDRFRRDSLARQSGGTWGTRYYLVSASDQRVAETRAEIRRNNSAVRADAAHDRWRHDRSAENAQAAIEALRLFIACEREVV